MRTQSVAMQNKNVLALEAFIERLCEEERKGEIRDDRDSAFYWRGFFSPYFRMARDDEDEAAATSEAAASGMGA